jgi:hypothetical protein
MTYIVPCKYRLRRLKMAVLLTTLLEILSIWVSLKCVLFMPSNVSASTELISKNLYSLLSFF